MDWHDRRPGGHASSALVNGAGIRRAPADRPAQERGAVERADAVPVPGRLEGAGVGTAALREVGQRRADRPVEPLQLGVVEAAGGPGGVEAGLEQRLVDEEVAEAGDLRLVHEPGLEGDAALA